MSEESGNGKKMNGDLVKILVALFAFEAGGTGISFLGQQESGAAAVRDPNRGLNITQKAEIRDINQQLIADLETRLGLCEKRAEMAVERALRERGLD